MMLFHMRVLLFLLCDTVALNVAPGIGSQGDDTGHGVVTKLGKFGEARRARTPLRRQELIDLRGRDRAGGDFLQCDDGSAIDRCGDSRRHTPP
jgi:hypothetical protein